MCDPDDSLGGTLQAKGGSVMSATPISVRTVLGIFVLALAGALPGSAQLVPPGKTTDQFYKNIQVLHGMPAEDLLPEMRLFAGALGGDCEFCHVQGDLSKDDKETKQKARQMIAMVLSLNKISFGGRTMVTCYTCHRGNSQPVTMPILPTVERSPEELERKATLPSADEVVAKYIQAIGGEQAIRKVTSRAITGTQIIPTGGGGRIPVEAQVVRYVKAPNLLMSVYRTDKFAISDGFDGMTAWSQDAKGTVANARSFDEMRIKANADLYGAVDLKQQYSGLTVMNMERVNGHDAYLLQSSAQAGGIFEQFYFDAQTGLLLRMVAVQPTPLGNFPSEEDYDDYRNTGSGVKIPFLVTTTPASANSSLAVTSTLRIAKVEDNVPIENAKLVKPESKAPQQQ